MPCTVGGGSRDAEGWVGGGVRMGYPHCSFCGRVVRVRGWGGHGPILCASATSAARAQIACWRARSKGGKEKKEQRERRKKGKEEKKEKKEKKERERIKESKKKKRIKKELKICA